MRKSNVLSILALIMSFSLMQTVNCQETPELQTPIPPGCARIIFTRIANFAGSGIRQALIDQGTGIQCNAVLEQRKSFPLEKSNFVASSNICLVLMKDSAITLIRNHKTTPLQIFYEDRATAMSSISTTNGPFSIGKDSIFNLIIPSKLNIYTVHGITSPGITYYPTEDEVKTDLRLDKLLAMKQNVYIFPWVITSGKIVSWDRTPGTMRLILSSAKSLVAETLKGDQVYAPSYKIEAGKTYWINYYYLKNRFEIFDKRPENTEN